MGNNSFYLNWHYVLQEAGSDQTFVETSVILYLEFLGYLHHIYTQENKYYVNNKEI